MVEADLTGTDDAENASKALRSVAVGNVADHIDEDAARQVRIVADANLRTVPGTFSRSLTSLSQSRNKVILSGTLALVAEYGMTGSHWFEWGRHKQPSRVPPPRFGRGRPKPEDGHVVGAAWQRMRKKATKAAADTMLDEYTIQFDKHRVPKAGV